MSLRCFAGVLALLACGGLVACGDEGTSPDAGPSRTDAGPPRDAGPRTDGGGDLDAGAMDAGPGDLVRCDPHDPDSCPDEQKCAVVVVSTGGDNEVRFECVPNETGLRGDGVPCDPRVPVPDTMNARTDNCRQGLVCLVTAGTTFAACHPLCGPDDVDCDRADYCRNANANPPFGVCTTPRNCDPIYNTGCAMGQNCYAVDNTYGDWLGECFEFVMADGGTGAVGEDCMFINTCQGGAQCFEEFFDGGMAGAFSCRDLCAPGGLDGGTALPGPGCDPSGSCSALPLADGGEYRTPTTPLGVCF